MEKISIDGDGGMPMFGKKRISIVLLLGVLLILGGCGTKKAVFNGNKFTDAKEFDLEFSVLDTTYSYEMEVGNGEYIDVQIQADAGNLNVEIRDDKGNPIYKGDNVSSGEFVVYTEKSGNHTFIVSGKKAKGYVRFSIKEEIEPDTPEVACQIMRKDRKYESNHLHVKYWKHEKVCKTSGKRT